MLWTTDKKIIFCLILISAAARADDIDLGKWQELSAVNQQRQQEIVQVYLPAKMEPTDSGAGVFQQVLNYQLQQARANSLPKIFDQKWNATVSNAAKENKTTYEMRPFETRACVQFSNGVKATVHYDVGSREMEYRLIPTAKFHGFNFAISHVNSPLDQEDKFTFGRDW